MLSDTSPSFEPTWDPPAWEMKAACVFPFVRQMEGHRHHSAQQVGHHRGDNQQRRHYHFSLGECFVWNPPPHPAHTREVKHFRYCCHCNGEKFQVSILCCAFICRRTWKWPSTSHAFSPPGTSSTNRTRSVPSESGGHDRHKNIPGLNGCEWCLLCLLSEYLCLGPLTRLHRSEDPPGAIASLW